MQIATSQLSQGLSRFLNLLHISLSAALEILKYRSTPTRIYIFIAQNTYCNTVRTHWPKISPDNASGPKIGARAHSRSKCPELLKNYNLQKVWYLVFWDTFLNTLCACKAFPDPHYQQMFQDLSRSQTLLHPVLHSKFRQRKQTFAMRIFKFRPRPTTLLDLTNAAHSLVFCIAAAPPWHLLQRVLKAQDRLTQSFCAKRELQKTFPFAVANLLSVTANWLIDLLWRPDRI